MDVDTLVQRLYKSIDEAFKANLDALRYSTTMEDVKYVQGMLDTMDDMKARIKSERLKLTKETIYDDEED